VLKPFRDLLKRVATWVLEQLIEPVTRRLHEWGLIESAAFAFCYLQVADGVRMSTYGSGDATAGMFVGLTGASLAVPAFAYTCMLWTLPLSREWMSQLVQLWLGLCWVPLTICFQSQLLAYLSMFVVLWLRVILIGDLAPVQSCTFQRKVQRTSAHHPSVTTGHCTTPAHSMIA
jgi:hypothetical protein